MVLFEHCSQVFLQKSMTIQKCMCLCLYKISSINNYYQYLYLENRGIVSLSGCVYLLASGDGVVGKAGFSLLSRHNSLLIYLHMLCVKRNIYVIHLYIVHIRSCMINLHTVGFGDWYYLRCKFAWFLLLIGYLKLFSPRLSGSLCYTKVRIKVHCSN